MRFNSGSMLTGVNVNELDRQVDAAMARVLNAEDAARAAIVACEQEAQVIRADARHCERRIAERALRRISRVRARMADRLAARLNAIADEPLIADPQTMPDAATQARLHRAVARLIDAMTGASR
jgi:tRNA isopentenyl-2-thiomethyl-A-37 hydroxylase MiaE